MPRPRRTAQTVKPTQVVRRKPRRLAASATRVRRAVEAGCRHLIIYRA